MGSISVGIRGLGKTVARILCRPITTHPFAVPPISGTFGIWQVRRDHATPLSHVLARAELGSIVYHC